MVAIVAALAMSVLNPPSALPQGDKAYKASCTIFVLKDCPIANQYAPELQRIMKGYSPKGILFMIVFEDSDVKRRDATEHAQMFGYHAATSIDPKHALAKRFGVTVSPSAVVSSGDKVLYVGRIDDLYATIGKRRPAPTKHDLRDALDSFLDGKPIKVKKTQAIGCRLF